MKEVKEEVQWDKKKIILFIFFSFVLLFAGYQLKTITLDKSASQPQNRSLTSDQSVKGATIQQSPADGLRNSIQENINNLKNEAQSINVADIATSSPQVQKVINDLKALQNYPSNQLKDTCINICNRL